MSLKSDKSDPRGSCVWVEARLMHDKCAPPLYTKREFMKHPKRLWLEWPLLLIQLVNEQTR